MIAIFKSKVSQKPHFLCDNTIDARFLGAVSDHVPNKPRRSMYYWEVNTRLSTAAIVAGVKMNPLIVDFGIDVKLPGSTSTASFHTSKEYKLLREEALNGIKNPFFSDTPMDVEM